MKSSSLKRFAAFTNIESGGNPAGVWVGDALPAPAEMQKIAAKVGFSETAFVSPCSGKYRKVRYFSPEAEVPFCGHATIASGVAIGKGSDDETYIFETSIGDIPVKISNNNGILSASLTSVEPQHASVSKTLLTDVLSALGWKEDELDLSIPPAKAFAGNWHLVLAVKSKSRLDSLHYEFEKLKTIMLNNELTTLQLIWRENEYFIHSRNPFPVGGVVEDSATGAAAVDLGGYLRDAKLVEAPIQIDILQGEINGRPSELKLYIPSKGGITVSGSAVEIE
ncbi:MAG: PhzF family phenazine biosynthesis protein [Kangiellaceae bacterium]|nr:PhzF family phenazine biosynthesis protein [Kangiellaceae bacterium]